MASKIEICNRALQILGSERIILLTDNNKRTRACNRAFEPCRLAELRAHAWNFAIKRAQLAAAGTTPLFGKNNYFPLPNDFVRLLPPDKCFNFNNRDWQIENQGIATNDTAPLNIRYIADITDPNKMDALFREALSARIAREMCEELTQSNSKKAETKDAYNTAILEARHINAFERESEEPPVDTWITAQR